jgi:predicted nuclease of predicted toxin-antitoxin system
VTRLLIDENISFKLARRLEDLFPGSQAVREVGLKGADDALVWEHARQHGHVILTKDLDLYERTLLLGHPPKIIRVEIGNCSTTQVETLVRWRATAILAFIADDGASCLALR